MPNTNPANYQESTARVSSGLADVVTCMEHMSTSHLEIMNKFKLIRAKWIRDRVNEANKIHEAIGVVEDKIHNLLDNTKWKFYTLWTKIL